MTGVDKLTEGAKVRIAKPAAKGQGGDAGSAAAGPGDQASPAPDQSAAKGSQRGPGSQGAPATHGAHSGQKSQKAQ